MNQLAPFPHAIVIHQDNADFGNTVFNGRATGGFQVDKGLGLHVYVLTVAAHLADQYALNADLRRMEAHGFHAGIGGNQ